MRSVVQFITWPAVAGILAAALILQWTASQRPQPVPTAAELVQQNPRVSFAAAVRLAAEHQAKLTGLYIIRMFSIPAYVDVQISTRVIEATPSISAEV